MLCIYFVLYEMLLLVWLINRLGKRKSVYLIAMQILWNENSLCTLSPSQIYLFHDPLYLGISVTLHGVGMDIFWNHIMV